MPFLLVLCMVLNPVHAIKAQTKVSEKEQRQLDAAVLSSKAGQYENAIVSIEKLIEQNPTWTAPKNELARIYYEQRRLPDAIAQLESSLRIDTSGQWAELFTLGRIYEESGNPDRAMACYKAIVMAESAGPKLAERAKTQCQALKEKKALFEPTYHIQPVALPPSINTEAHESLGRWSLDAKQLLFTRMVDGQEDLMIATREKETDHWQVDFLPHTTAWAEGAHAISPNKKYIVFTSCNRPDGYGGCDLYISVLKDGEYTKPVHMGPNFNTPSRDAQPCFGFDGLELYFASDRPGGQGGTDIWYMRQLSSDVWSSPINAGPDVNTPDNEESPYVHFDGRTLYFMRDGKGGLGGSDLYISRKSLDGKWLKAENMGAPINTGADEGALSLHPDGIHALLTRDNPDTKNDLYEFVLPEAFRSIPQQALRVQVKDHFTGKPLQANLDIFELNGDPKVRLSQIGDVQGVILTPVNQNTAYGLIANCNGYLIASLQLEANSETERFVEMTMVPLQESVNEIIVLENIGFETGSAVLLPASQPELNKLLYTLKSNINLAIEIRGHTDDTGDVYANQKLSEARAEVVYQFLLEKGIPAYRLSFRGFGETSPIADNATEEGRSKNRRTEFAVIRK